MTPVEENLLSALRSELWQTPLQLSLSPKEAEELLDEAREHAVETIAARALVDNNIPIGKQLVPRCLYALQHTREGNDHQWLKGRCRGLFMPTPRCAIRAT